MRIIKLGAGFLVVAAVAGAMAASASALTAPEWGRCVELATRTGGFGGKTCTTIAGKHKGPFEWFPEPSAKPGFTGEGDEVVFETTSGRKFTCAVIDEVGSYTGPKTEKTTVTAVGCDTRLGGELTNCRSNPLKEGEIETPELEGEIGFVKVNEKKKVGLDLKPKVAGTPLASFTCGALPGPTISVTIEGSVIGQVGPLNHMTAEFFGHYKTVAAGTQQIQSFEGGEPDTLSFKIAEGLELPKTEAGSLHMKYLQVNEETAEINSKV